MKRTIGGTGPALVWADVVLLSLIAAANSTIAAELKEATITQIVKDVHLLPAQAAARPAVVNDSVREGTAVRTGGESRTELTFTDQTLARLGANTIFSFNEGTRNLDLTGGAMLLRVPKGAGGAKITTAAITAAITGTTVMIEYHPGAVVESGDRSARAEKKARAPFAFLTWKSKPAPPTTRGGYVKFITLEGVARVYLNGRHGESVLVGPGQMLILQPDANNLPDPVYIDLERLIQTSLLITDFPPLGSEQLMANEVRNQQQQKAQGELTDTNLVFFGRGSLVSLIDPPPLDSIDLSIAAFGLQPAGFASEFGPLITITSPNPYVINSGTKIMTAPTITTGGVTNQGSLYRGLALDGAVATFMFGSTSLFDQTSGFTEQFVQSSNLPLAVFRFSNLRITGNPTISIPAGGATKLALISEGAITSAAPGGTLTFSGLDTVLLATVNGSITLTPDVTFSGLPLLVFHARGATSNVTIASPFTGVGTAELQAENSIQVNAAEGVTTFLAFAGADFLDGTGHVTAQNVNIVAGNNINFTASDFAVPPGVTTVSLDAVNTINLDITTNQSVFTQANSVFVRGATINVTADPGGTTLQFGNLAAVNFVAGAGGIQAIETTFLQTSNMMEFTSQGDIVANEITGGDTVQSTAGSIHVSSGLTANGIFANMDITSAGDLIGFNSISAGGHIGVTNTLLSPSVSAGGNITAGHVEVQNINPFVPTTTTTLTAGAGGITPFIGPSGSALQHTFNVMTVVSPNGINFSGANFGTAADGGLLTINAQTQDFSSAGINGTNLDGADAPPMPGSNPGSGGTLTVNTTGDLNLTGTTISATTGIIDTNAPQPLGAGGTVNLTSSAGTVTVNNSRVQVSSKDAIGTANRRSSARGGNIAIESDRPSNLAINITNSAQLLSLLENAAPGPGGLITIKATGTMSTVSVGGQIEADKGGVDIRHTGDLGTVTLSTMNVRGDIIKVAALGSTGILSIGNGVLNADTTLKLYAPGSNGQIIFTSNCAIGGGSSTILAANAVTINNGVMVNVTGHKADVFVNSTVGVPNANYTGFGGNNTTTGTFAGLGANNPQPLSAAPPLGVPGGP